MSTCRCEHCVKSNPEFRFKAAMGRLANFMLWAEMEARANEYYPMSDLTVGIRRMYELRIAILNGEFRLRWGNE